MLLLLVQYAAKVARKRPNKALQQNRGDVLRSGESLGCDLLKAAVPP